MNQQQGTRKIIRFMVIWIVAGSFPSLASAFLQDSKATTASRGNICRGLSSSRSIAVSRTQLVLRKQDHDEAVTKKISRDKKSFGSISTRIHMVGSLVNDENGRLEGETRSVIPKTCRQGLAHGILCPETVNKMEASTFGGRNNRAVKAFLDRYHKQGPMSCMELLSDPEILPHLTTAMRDIL